MFPSNSNGNNDPIVYIDHSILHGHFCTDTPCIKTDDLPLSFFHFPSPYYNQCELELEDHVVFGSQHGQFLQQKAMVIDNSVSETIINMPGCGNVMTDHCVQQMPRKGSKRDRHSKINTANGPRDRRMRLSLNVSREFFGLQDMLGYDKASRTVEWLLIKARPEIKKLMNNKSFSFAGSKSSSSTSEAEVVSGVVNNGAIDGSISEGKPSKKEKKERRQRETSFRPLARDLRDKARERARARTKAKSMLLSQSSCNETRDNDLNKFGSWSSSETGKESGVKLHNVNNPFSQPDNLKLHGDQIIDESLSIMNKWSPSLIFSCLQNTEQQQQQQFTGSFLW